MIYNLSGDGPDKVANLPSPEEYAARVQGILGSQTLERPVWSTPDEARQRLNQLEVIQNELRKLQQEVQQSLQILDSSTAAHRNRLRLDAVESIFIKRRGARQAHAAKREMARRQQETIISPYKALSAQLLETLAVVEQAKRDIGKSLTQER